MRKIAIALLLCGLIGIAGCSEIPELSESEEFSYYDPDSDSSAGGISDQYTANKFDIIKQNFLSKLNAEGGVFEGSERIDGEFDGRGYVHLSTGQRLTHIVNVNTTQHYRVIIAARSDGDAAVKFYVKKRSEGAFYLPANAADLAEETLPGGFRYFAVDSVFLMGGSNVLDFVVEKGNVDLDFIVVENSEAVDSRVYRTGTSAANPSAGLGTVGMMKYLSDMYGKNTLTAVNVTTGTNAEIDAIYKAANRYPAIRVSELAPAVMDDENSKYKIDKDVEYALDWAKNNGIVAYKWHWYSPTSERSVDADAFDMEEALDIVNLSEIALTKTEDIRILVENGYLPLNTLALINDIDKAAEVLKRFSSEDVTVIFEPLPNPDSGLYWWGNDPAQHRKLYALVFDRMCRYHKLSNLVWVWSGSDAKYYPGENYVDIIGQSIFENSDSAFPGRFTALANAFPTKKPLAVTACDVLPSIDSEVRDNALWLWCAVESGKYIIKETGAFSSEYNSLSSLDAIYNSDLCVTRDELPDISKYALGG